MAKKTFASKEKVYSNIRFIIKVGLLIVWLMRDIKYRKDNPDLFTEFGLTMFTGRQGAGKTIALVEHLEQLRRKYPKAIIVTNFGYEHEDMSFTDWNMLFDVRNGEEGVIFCIDEIQNEFSSAKSKTFPEGLLSEITQQRKQRIKILATSQVFTRVAKPLREQCYEVVECVTVFGRWTWCKCFDAEDYNLVIDSNNPSEKMKIRRKWRKNFIQDNEIREKYDSYAKVERMKATEYIRETK